MKILIGAACACVIGMTAFFFISQFLQQRHAERVAFWDYCQQLDSPEMKAKLAKWTDERNSSAIRVEMKKVEKCMDVARHGF